MADSHLTPPHLTSRHQGGKEWAVVGTYDEASQALVDVAPRQQLDGGLVT